MSRIGKQPVVVDAAIKVDLKGGTLNVQGPKGKLSQTFREEVSIAWDEAAKQIQVTRNGETPFHRAYHGTSRALIANMIKGVKDGFSRNLDIVGVGYNAKLQGKKIILAIGFCHPVEIPIPEGLEVECPKPVRIEIKGADKQLVGEFAAQIRRIRKPEPYKGKGIKYENEHIIRKAGKSFGA